MTTQSMNFLSARLVPLPPLNVCEVGRENSPTLVFLHGNRRTWEDWKPQLEALGSRYRCVAYDLRGFGRSEAVSGLFSLSAFADEAAALCDSLDVAHAYFVGVSLGAQTAELVALRHPEKVDGVILAGCPYFGPDFDPSPGQWPETAESLRQMSDEELRAEARRREPDHPSVDDMESSIQIFYEQARRGQLRLVPEDFGSLKRYEEIRVPALVVEGEQEHYFYCKDPDTTQMTARIPVAEHVKIPGAGHLSNLDAPAAFNEHLVDFVTRHPPSKRLTLPR